MRAHWSTAQISRRLSHSSGKHVVTGPTHAPGTTLETKRTTEHSVGLRLQHLQFGREMATEPTQQPRLHVRTNTEHTPQNGTDARERALPVT